MGGVIKHGMSRTYEYRSWISMKKRCLNPNDQAYSDYGGRGIMVHEPWVENFEEFFAHIGKRPDGTSLDRKNTNGHYEPGNVQWSSHNEQARNRRSSYFWEINGMVFDCAQSAADFHGVLARTIHRWVKGHGKFKPKNGCFMKRKYK